jgi:hypothetical protein
MKKHLSPERAQLSNDSPAPFPLYARRSQPFLHFLDAPVLPAQFFAHPRRDTHAHGAVALLRAVLTDAIACYQYRTTAHSQRSQQLAREAEAWLFSNDTHWLFSFINVCAVLGLDPVYLRSGLIRRRNADPSTTNHRLRALVDAPRLPRVTA